MHVHGLVAKVLKMHKSCSKEKRSKQMHGNSDALLRILSDFELSVINRGFSVRLVVANEKYNLPRKKTCVNTR